MTMSQLAEPLRGLRMVAVMDREADCSDVMAKYQCLSEVESVVPANQAWSKLGPEPAEDVCGDSGADAASAMVQRYLLRELIENWHRILKSGCKVEFLMHRRGERIERAITINAMIAWRRWSCWVGKSRNCQ